MGNVASQGRVQGMICQCREKQVYGSVERAFESPSWLQSGKPGPDQYSHVKYTHHSPSFSHARDTLSYASFHLAIVFCTPWGYGEWREVQLCSFFLNKMPI